MDGRDLGERLAALEAQMAAQGLTMVDMRSDLRKTRDRVDAIERGQLADDARASAAAQLAARATADETRRERRLFALAGVTLTTINVAAAALMPVLLK